MNKGFEVHPPGTAEEILLSRNLARSIEQIDFQYPGTVPHSVMQSFSELKKFYDKCLEESGQ